MMIAQPTREEREIVKAFEAGTPQSPPDRSAILKVKIDMPGFFGPVITGE